MNYQELCLPESSTAKQAMQLINSLGIPNLALFITDNKNKLVGSLSDGDIRRGILNGRDLGEPVSSFMNIQMKYFIKGVNNFENYSKYKSLGIRFVPLVNEDLYILDLIDLEKSKSFLPVDAIIMAGGRGERLGSLTEKTPKPMLNIGDKPVIMWNLERLHDFGITNIFITVRYLKEFIISGLNHVRPEIKFVTEDHPLGTIGAVKLITHFNSDYLLLMNSDVLTNIDFEEFFQNFINSEADLQIATIPYNVTIPYGVVETNETNNKVINLKEKPRYTYYTNAGIYLFKKQLIDWIPENTKFDATDFIELLIKNNFKIVPFPMYCYWLDIGQPEDFLKAQEDIKHLDF